MHTDVGATLSQPPHEQAAVVLAGQVTWQPRIVFGASYTESRHGVHVVSGQAHCSARAERLKARTNRNVRVAVYTTRPPGQG